MQLSGSAREWHQMFKLPEIQGHICPKEYKDVIYFSCDYEYFYKHGYALAKSIFGTIGWIHVHIHIINEGNIDHAVLKEFTKLHSFTYTWEDIDPQFYIALPKRLHQMRDGYSIFNIADPDYVARRTYLASVRFMRLPQLFKHEDTHVLQIDCDSILRTAFHQSTFRELAKHVGVMPKPKDPATFIASAVTLGTGPIGLEFRELFATRLIEGFEKGCYWYIDQHVLKDVMKEWKVVRNKPHNNIPFKWNCWGIKKDDIFSTGKGNKKETTKYRAAQLKWLPNDLYHAAIAEIKAKNGS